MKKTQKEMSELMEDLCELGYFSREIEAVSEAKSDMITTYSFKSAVIGRAVYTSMPPELRKIHHSAVAAWFTTQFFGGDHLTASEHSYQLYKMLAHHKSKSSDHARAAELYFFGAVRAARTASWEEGGCFEAGINKRSKAHTHSNNHSLIH